MGNFLICTPSGRCPHILENTEVDTIIEWAKRFEDGCKNGFYSLEAVAYWVRDFYEPNTEEWKKVRDILYENSHLLKLTKAMTYEEIRLKLMVQRNEGRKI